MWEFRLESVVSRNYMGMIMAVKKIYVHPDDMVEICIVHDKDVPANKTEWNHQRHDQQHPVQLSIRSQTLVGFTDVGYKFQLEGIGGVFRRWLN